MPVLATAKALAKLDCGIRLCLPDGDGGYGVADAIAEGGYRNMIAWIRNAGIRWFRRGPTVPAVAVYLEDLPAGQWAVDPADLYAAAGVEKHPDRHTVALIRETAASAGWEYRRGEAQAVPGPGDVRAQGSRNRKACPKLAVLMDEAEPDVSRLHELPQGAPPEIALHKPDRTAPMPRSSVAPTSVGYPFPTKPPSHGSSAPSFSSRTTSGPSQGDT